MNLKETCQMTDQEFEERTKTRAEETKAVSEALSGEKFGIKGCVESSSPRAQPRPSP